MEFKYKYAFLSNMYGSSESQDSNFVVSCDDLIKYSDPALHDYIRKYLPNGYMFSCVECAFQAFKTNDLMDFIGLLNIRSGYEARAAGRAVKVRKGWTNYRVDIMRCLVREKFAQNPSLATKLALMTETIKEENTWNDYFWGVCNGRGQNQLGLILSEVRATYQKKEEVKSEGYKKADFGSFRLKNDYFLNVKEFLEEINERGYFFVADTETTGTNPRFNDVIEISAIKVNSDFEIVEEFDSFINPGYLLPPEIVAFNEKNGTGICDELLKDAPKPKDATKAFRAFVGDDPLILGQNIQFDIRFINKLYKKQLKEEFDPINCDTLKMAKEKLPGSHKLIDLYVQIDNAPEMTFHKSIDDVKATLEVFKWLVPKYGLNLKENNKEQINLEL